MQTLRVRNVQDALPEAVRYVNEGLKHGWVVPQDSRNGKVFRSDMPVTTLYDRPRERVIFHPERDANPFFHFMEGLWMIGGRNDVDWITQFNKSFAQFSDDGETFHGAYGARWRGWFDGIDQVESVAEILRKNTLDRRAVIQMWDSTQDLGRDGKDFPCNLIICVSVSVHGHLDMMVTCRSNDIVWGAYGANAVHMSMLQEYIAAAVGVPTGRYWQVSYNWHAYENTFEMVKNLDEKTPPGLVSDYNPYKNFEPYPMVTVDHKTWMQDLHVFLEDGPIIGFRDSFFRRVAVPIYQSWMAKEDKDDKYRYQKALEIIDQCAAPDWKLACQEWLQRRMKGGK